MKVLSTANACPPPPPVAAIAWLSRPYAFRRQVGVTPSRLDRHVCGPGHESVSVVALPLRRRGTGDARARRNELRDEPSAAPDATAAARKDGGTAAVPKSTTSLSPPTTVVAVAAWRRASSSRTAR